ncbi:MAG: iron-sulfur cluster repair di-iron protein [Saprospiraceae bacterium]|nr:iron-sulfur cluster repair di-iron protein [Saprospiraceae bacterium]
MELTTKKTVAELVVQNYKAADVFKKYGIDFCCGGKIPLEEICMKKNIDLDRIHADLLALDLEFEDKENYESWPLDELVDHIIAKHHSYVSENLPLISQYAEKVARVHGHHRPETIEIRNQFSTLSQELTSHMMKEERILFPFIKALVYADRQGQSSPVPPFGSVANPVSMMEHEHDTAGSLVKEISALSDNYTPPPEACNTYRVLYYKLEEFEGDLHKHIHLENNILFPKAVQLEKQLEQKINN